MRGKPATILRFLTFSGISFDVRVKIGITPFQCDSWLLRGARKNMFDFRKLVKNRFLKSQNRGGFAQLVGQTHHGHIF